MRYSIILLFILAKCSPHSSSKIFISKDGALRGITFVAPPQQYSDTAMAKITAVNANSIAIIPYAFGKIEDGSIHYGESKYKWWGESRAGVIYTILDAKKRNLIVMLKPQIWMHDHWTGDMQLDNESKWKRWEDDYRKYILDFAKIADSTNVDLFCIGTELKNCLNHNPHYWSNLIADIRKIYKSKITYAANWDEFQNCILWDKVDYIGINAYFPLLNEKQPTINQLKKAWEKYLPEMQKVSSKYQKSVLFTEYGYLCVDGCSFNTWELESKIDQLPKNEEAQANAFKALYEVMHIQPYWCGGYMWKWFPDMHGHEGYPDKDYTCQDKLAQKVMSEYYFTIKKN
jgi:hypothetical protein